MAEDVSIRLPRHLTSLPIDILEGKQTLWQAYYLSEFQLMQEWDLLEQRYFSVNIVLLAANRAP